MKKLLRYLKNYKKESIIGPLFKLTEAIFELIVPIVMSDIIDVGIVNGDTRYILGKGAVLLLFGLIGLCCSLTAQYFAAKASVGFGTELRHDMFSYIMNLSYSELDEAGAATLINRLTVDVNQVQSGVNLALRLFLRSPFIVVGAVIMSFTIDPTTALISLIATPVIAFVIYFIMIKTIPRYKRIQDKLDKVSALSRANLSGVRVIRAFARQSEEKKHFSATTDELYDISISTGRISALLNPLSYVLLNGAIVLIIYVGGFRVDSGRITQGEVIALVNYMSQILLALVAMVNLINSFMKALASAERVTEVFDPDTAGSDIKDGMDAAELSGSGTNPAAAPAKKSGTPVISFDSVSFSYAGADADALTDISIDIARGETIGVIGGTGAGKTTFINLMAGFYRASGGTVKVNGQPVENLGADELHRIFSIVPQRKDLFKGTIRENLLFGREADDAELNRALEISQAAEFVNKPGVGLDYMIEQGGTNLSGGQQQRLTIARALVNCGEVLILDDSASALDFATDAALRKAVASLPGDLTIIIVSQRIGSIMNSDRILVLDDGLQAGLGTHSELLESCAIYKEIFDSQTK